MWKQHYRRTLLPMQFTIVGICLALIFVAKMPWIGIVVYLVVLEAFSLLGAMWVTRLKRKFMPRSRCSEYDLKTR